MVDHGKIDVVLHWPIPQTLKKLREFLFSLDVIVYLSLTMIPLPNLIPRNFIRMPLHWLTLKGKLSPI